MGTTIARLTAEEYLALPADQTFRTELIGGEIVPMGNARFGHEFVKARLNRLLVAASGATGLLFNETAYRLSEGDLLIPDLSYLTFSHVAGMDRNTQAVGAPDLAVEVVSSDDADALEEKLRLYLKHGTQEVWVVYPTARSVYVHRQGSVVRLGEEDTLRSAVFPELSVAVRDVFEASAVS